MRSTKDETEDTRREMVGVINGVGVDTIKESFEKVWTTDELCQEFTVTGFLASFVSVIRKSDGKQGSMCFKHNPRVYFDLKMEDE